VTGVQTCALPIYYEYNKVAIGDLLKVTKFNYKHPHDPLGMVGVVLDKTWINDCPMFRVLVPTQSPCIVCLSYDELDRLV
jgi:hypothetical protein